MRNLKKILALVLALMMTLSLMVTASADYTDQADVDYDEAVAVMSAVKVFNGGDGGNFYPDLPLKRDAAAKIITYMVLGQETADNLVGNVDFVDVAPNYWAAPSIAYCVDQHILDGGDANHFYPDYTVTGVGFAKMLLGALGYRTDYENYTGSNWELNVTIQANKLHLFDNVDLNSVRDNLTREQGCQMAFNAIHANTVSYTGGLDINLGNGQSITQNATRVDSGNTFMALNYPNLHKVTSSFKGENPFGRPVDYEWQMGTGANAVAVYVAAQSATLLAPGATLNPNTTSITSATLKTNGNPGSPLTTLAGVEALAGNGKTVEVYTNSAGAITAVVVINYVAAKITNKTEDTITLGYGANYDTSTITVTAKNANKAFYDTLATKEKDSYVTVAVDNAGTGILALGTANVITGTVTAKTTSPVTYTIAGAPHKEAANKQVTYSVLAPSVHATNVVYALVDAEGYILDFLDGPSAGPVPVNTVYITSIWSVAGQYGDTTPMFQGVLPDGVTITGTYNTTAGTLSDGATAIVTAPTKQTAYQYEVDANGVYSLAAAANNAGKEGALLLSNGDTTDSTQRKLGSNFYASNVKFVFITGGGSTLKVDTQTGVKNVTLASDSTATTTHNYGYDYAVIAKDVDNNYVVTTVYVYGETATDSDVASSDLIYLVSTTATGSALGTNGTTVLNTYEAYVNGTKQTITSAQTSGQLTTGWNTFVVNPTTGAYTLTTTSEGVKTAAAADAIDHVNGEYLVTVSGLTLFNADNAKVVDLRAPAPGQTAINTIAGLYATPGTRTIAVAYDTASKTISTIYVISVAVPHSHSWATAWTTTSATHHWHECQNGGCTATDAQKDGYGTHAWVKGDTAGQLKCSTCAKTTSCDHSDNTNTSWDASTGTMTCSACDGTITCNHAGCEDDTGSTHACSICGLNPCTKSH